MLITKSIFYFILAGLYEIGGGLLCIGREPRELMNSIYDSGHVQFEAFDSKCWDKVEETNHEDTFYLERCPLWNRTQL